MEEGLATHNNVLKVLSSILLYLQSCHSCQHIDVILLRILLLRPSPLFLAVRIGGWAKTAALASVRWFKGKSP
jgi:hypothetical protein